MVPKPVGSIPAQLASCMLSNQRGQQQPRRPRPVQEIGPQDSMALDSLGQALVTSKLPSVIRMSQTMQRQTLDNNNNKVLLGRMLGYLFFSLFSSLFARSNVPCMCPDGNDWKEMESRVNMVDSKARFLSTSLPTPGIKLPSVHRPCLSSRPTLDTGQTTSSPLSFARPGIHSHRNPIMPQPIQVLAQAGIPQVQVN